MEDLLSDLEYAPALASKTKRWLACVIDYVIYYAIVFFMIYVFGKQGSADPEDTAWHLNGFPFFLAMVLPWVLFFPGIESFNGGQTLGKALFRIKTVKEDGSKINFGESFLKHFFDWVDYLPFFGICGMIVASNNNKKQRVGDLVAKTIVVNSRS
jgi:uncharacterized RDD family membrane protein YckC